MLLALFASCSKEDEIHFSVSQEEVSIQVSGGEQSVTVTTDGDWSCSYDADWLLVREQQNKIRIIAANFSMKPKTKARYNSECCLSQSIGRLLEKDLDI